jgi:hypothetical protein
LVGRSRIVRNAIDVELSGIGARSQKAQGGRSHQQLLEKFHLFLTQEVPKILGLIILLWLESIRRNKTPQGNVSFDSFSGSYLRY